MRNNLRKGLYIAFCFFCQEGIWQIRKLILFMLWLWKKQEKKNILNLMKKFQKWAFVFAGIGLFLAFSGFLVLKTIQENRDEVVIVQRNNSETTVQKTQLDGKDSKLQDENLKIGSEEVELKSSDVLGQELVKISVNLASEEELDTVPGVGEATIKKIVEGRPWKDLEDVLLLINKRYREEARVRIRL